MEISDKMIEAAARAIYHVSCGTESPRYRFNTNDLPKSDWDIYFQKATAALEAAAEVYSRSVPTLAKTLGERERA